MIAIHIDLSRRFCITGVSEQGSAHECVLKLRALYGSVVRGFVTVLLFVERVGQCKSLPPPPKFFLAFSLGGISCAGKLVGLPM